MDFLNSLLFVGLNKEYILVDIVQGRSCKQICSINKGTKVPFCVPIEQEGIGDENENHEQGEMLLANDRKGLFYDFVGSPAREYFSSLIFIYRKDRIWIGLQMQ